MTRFEKANVAIVAILIAAALCIVAYMHQDRCVLCRQFRWPVFERAKEGV